MQLDARKLRFMHMRFVCPRLWMMLAVVAFVAALLAGWQMNRRSKAYQASATQYAQQEAFYRNMQASFEELTAIEEKFAAEGDG